MAFPNVTLRDNGSGSFDIVLGTSGGSSGIKSVSGILLANIKKVAGVAIGNTKKVAGVIKSVLSGILKWARFIFGVQYRTIETLNK